MTSAPDVSDELASNLVVDITTTGRLTGRPRRIEIWWFRVDGRFIITGTPGRRDWYANMLANPSIIVHTPSGSFSAQASPILDESERLRVVSDPQLSWYRQQVVVDDLVKGSPMVELDVDFTPLTPVTPPES